MNHYVVVAETGADIPQRFVDELDLRIVPMHVQFGGESHDDGQFPASVVFDHYKKTGELPKTSGCTPADFDTAFSKIYKEDPDAKVVYLAYSSVTRNQKLTAENAYRSFGKNNVKCALDRNGGILYEKFFVFRIIVYVFGDTAIFKFLVYHSSENLRIFADVFINYSERYFFF